MYANTHQRLVSNSKDNLFFPRASKTNEDILYRYVLDLSLVVVFRIIAEDDALHFVGCPAKPAVIIVSEDGLELGLRACDVAHITNTHAQSARQNTAQMSGRVGELVCLMISAVHRDEDTQIVLAGHNLDGGTGELGCNLVEALGMKALFGAINVESADWRVMRGLLCQVGNPHWLCRVGCRLSD